MKVFALLLALASSPAVAAVPTPKAIARQVEREGLKAKTLQTISLILMAGTAKLRAEGFTEEALDVEETWTMGWEPYLTSNSAIGDHAPLSVYLAEVCLIFESLLGREAYEALHLDDLEILNFGLVVALEPDQASAWCQETQEASCSLDYSLHAVPVLGVCAYWLAWGACTGATWGMGAVTLICTPIGMVSEKAMLELFAPRIAARIWDRRN